MPKMIQLRNVPDALHRSLKARAAMAGMSLSDYLLAEIKELAERPTLAEFRNRLRTRKAITVQLDSARLVREEREARWSSWMRLRRLTGCFRLPRDNELRRGFTRAASLFMLRTFSTLRLRRSCGGSCGRLQFPHNVPIRHSRTCSIFA